MSRKREAWPATDSFSRPALAGRNMTNAHITAARISGRIAGTTVRHLVWLNDQIDWTEVGAIVLHGLQVLVVLTLLAGRGTRRLWDQLPAFSERMGKAYSRLVVRTTAPTEQVTIAPQPVMSPLVTMAQELEQLTVRELMAIVGTRRKLAKRQLIEMAVAIA